MATFTEHFAAAEITLDRTEHRDGLVYVDVKGVTAVTDPDGRRVLILPLKFTGASKNLILIERGVDGEDGIQAKLPAGMVPDCLQGDCSSRLDSIVNAMATLNGVMEDHVDDTHRQRLKDLSLGNLGTLIELAYQSVTVFRGEVALCSLPTWTAKALHQEGRLYYVESEGHELYPRYVGGDLQAPTPKGGVWVPYNPTLGHRVGYPQTDSSLEVILTNLALD